MADRFRSLILVACLQVSALAGAQTNPFAGDPKAVEAGRGAFRVVCSPCHGILGKGGRGPDLTIGVYMAGDSDGDLFRVIADGVPGSEELARQLQHRDAGQRTISFDASNPKAAYPRPPNRYGCRKEGRGD